MDRTPCQQCLLLNPVSLYLVYFLTILYDLWCVSIHKQGYYLKHKFKQIILIYVAKI